MKDDFYIYQRDLPHWRADQVIYFVTWRLYQHQEPLIAEERTVVAAALQHFHRERYWLSAFVVMDDHVHVVVRTIKEFSLSKILHSWKTYSAYQLQRLHGRQGRIWQAESYDRIVRERHELENTLAYVANNPTKRWPDVHDYQWVGFLDEC